MRPLLAAFATVAALLLGASPAAALSGPEEIAFLNAQRAASGIPADVTEVPEWSAGCASHMAYLRLNGLFQHDEDPVAFPNGYTQAGDDAGNASVLTSGGASFSPTGANAFEHAPIHLMQMLSPWLLRSGAADGCLATLRDIGRTFPAQTTFSYPGDGGQASISERAAEQPFVPGDFVGLPQGTATGPHLYFFNASPAGYWASVGAITAATLTGPTGPVEVRTVDNTTTSPAPLGPIGTYLAPGGIVVPVAPLQKNALYTASVSFQPSNGSPLVQRTWSFTTGVVAPTPAAPAAPVGTPTPKATSTPAASPLSVDALRLGARGLSLRATQAASVWVSIEQRTSARRGRVARWTVRRAYALELRAGVLQRASHRRLARGRYRVQVRLGGADGQVAVTKTLRVG